jgi:hypothetical protein
MLVTPMYMRGHDRKKFDEESVAPSIDAKYRPNFFNY